MIIAEMLLRTPDTRDRREADAVVAEVRATPPAHQLTARLRSTVPGTIVCSVVKSGSSFTWRVSKPEAVTSSGNSGSHFSCSGTRADPSCFVVRSFVCGMLTRNGNSPPHDNGSYVTLMTAFGIGCLLS